MSYLIGGEIIEFDLDVFEKSLKQRIELISGINVYVNKINVIAKKNEWVSFNIEASTNIYSIITESNRGSI